jgi:hypothetical protein
MTMSEYNDPDAFNGIIHNGFGVNPNPQTSPQQPSHTDPHPYGPPAAHQGHPVKTGLTPRGKAAIAIAATVVAGGGLLGWQHYASAQAANEVKAKELAIEQQKLDLEQQKALEKANKEAAKTQTSAESARQKQIDACVQDNKGLVGHQLGATLSSVIQDCQTQYPASTSTGDMQEAASTSSTDGGAGASNFLLVGGGFLVVGAWVFVRRATRPTPAPAPYAIYPGPYQQ